MATAMTQMLSTPGAGPSSSSSPGLISRSTSASSHASTNASVSDDEEEWLGPFREELRRNQQTRRTDLLQQAELEFQRASSSLAARHARVGAVDWLPDHAYEAAKAKLFKMPITGGSCSKVLKMMTISCLAIRTEKMGTRKHFFNAT